MLYTKRLAGYRNETVSRRKIASVGEKSIIITPMSLCFRSESAVLVESKHLKETPLLSVSREDGIQPLNSVNTVVLRRLIVDNINCMS